MFGSMGRLGSGEAAHLWYAWDKLYAYALCGAIYKKVRGIGDPDYLSTSVGSGQVCDHCLTRRNELEAAYYDNHRLDS